MMPYPAVLSGASGWNLYVMAPFGWGTHLSQVVLPHQVHCLVFNQNIALVPQVGQVPNHTPQVNVNLNTAVANKALFVLNTTIVAHIFLGSVMCKGFILPKPSNQRLMRFYIKKALNTQRHNRLL